MLASKTPQPKHTAKRNLSKHKAIPPKQPSSEKYRFRNPHRRIVVVSSQQDIEAQRQRAIADSKKLYVCFSRGIAPINNILKELDSCVDRIMDAERLFVIHDFTIDADASMMLRKIGVALDKADSLGLESAQLVRYKELLHRAVATFTQKSLLSTSSYQSSSVVVPLNLHASCSRFRDDVACVRYVSQVVCQMHKMYGRKVRF
jgi:hypothetical protein